MAKWSDTLALLKIRLFGLTDRKSTRLNSSHDQISYAVFCLKKKKNGGPANLAARRRQLEARLEHAPQTACCVLHRLAFRSHEIDTPYIRQPLRHVHRVMSA